MDTVRIRAEWPESHCRPIYQPSAMAHADLEAALRRMRAELRDESYTKIGLAGALRGVRSRRRALMRGRGAAAAAAAGRSIDDAGAAAIAEALKINKTVTTIDLSSALCAARDRAECCGARGGGGAARKLMGGARQLDWPSGCRGDR